MSLITQQVQAMISGGLYQSETRASANALILANGLFIAKKYLITDPIDGGQVLLTASSVNTFEPNGSWLRTNEFRAFGFFRLSGVAGSVTDVNVLGVNQLTASIPFSVNAITTAQNTANNINANGARVVNAVLCPGDTTLQNPYIVLERLTGGVNTNAVTVTTVTMVADDIQNMANGAVSVDVVYSIEYKFGPTPEESRIVRCYDAENSCDITVDYQTAITGNSISGYDVFGVKKPGFFRRGSVYASYIKAMNFNWEAVFQHSNFSQGRLTVNILQVVQCLFRGFGNPSNITSSGALSFFYVTNGALASFVSNFFGPFQQTFSNQSFGNLVLSGCQFVGSQSAFTTRVTHSVGTTQLRLNAEQTTFSIITARALGGTTTQIKTGRNSIFTLNYASTSALNALGKIDVAGGSTFSMTNTGIGALANITNGVTIGHNSNLTMTIDGTAVTTLQRTIINGASHTFIAPGVLLNNFNSSNQSTAVSITSANQVDLSNTNIDNNYFRRMFTKTLTGAANFGLSGSPVFLGNLILNFRATNTVRQATGLTGVGALLQLGIETDDDDAMIPATAIAVLNDRSIFDSPVNTQATAVDRRIIATPTIATITAGTIQGYVEGYIS